jgi:hypothetical protein
MALDKVTGFFSIAFIAASGNETKI